MPLRETQYCQPGQSTGVAAIWDRSRITARSGSRPLGPPNRPGQRKRSSSSRSKISGLIKLERKIDQEQVPCTSRRAGTSCKGQSGHEVRLWEARQDCCVEKPRQVLAINRKIGNPASAQRKKTWRRWVVAAATRGTYFRRSWSAATQPGSGGTEKTGGSTGPPTSVFDGPNLAFPVP